MVSRVISNKSGLITRAKMTGLTVCLVVIAMIITQLITATPVVAQNVVLSSYTGSPHWRSRQNPRAGDPLR